MRHGTLPTVKLTLFSAPIRSSFALWFIRSKSCGMNAASVSALNSAGTSLATRKPSGSVTTTPTTPGRAIARATTSFGGAWRLREIGMGNRRRRIQRFPPALAVSPFSLQT